VQRVSCIMKRWTKRPYGQHRIRLVDGWASQPRIQLRLPLSRDAGWPLVPGGGRRGGRGRGCPRFDVFAAGFAGVHAVFFFFFAVKIKQAFLISATAERHNAGSEATCASRSCKINIVAPPFEPRDPWRTTAHGAVSLLPDGVGRDTRQLIGAAAQEGRSSGKEKKPGISLYTHLTAPAITADSCALKTARGGLSPSPAVGSVRAAPATSDPPSTAMRQSSFKRSAETSGSKTISEAMINGMFSALDADQILGQMDRVQADRGAPLPGPQRYAVKRDQFSIGRPCGDDALGGLLHRLWGVLRVWVHKCINFFRNNFQSKTAGEEINPLP